MSSLTYPDQLQLATLGLAAGRTPSDVGLGGSWTITDHSQVIGYGLECLENATARLLTWQAHQHAGVKVARDGPVVQISFGPTQSPCLILHEKTSANRTALVYGTLPGHIERGEEAFLIDMADDGTVTGRCVAFSTHAWWLARLGAPVARYVQRVITRRYVQGMAPQ